MKKIPSSLWTQFEKEKKSWTGFWRWLLNRKTASNSHQVLASCFRISTDWINWSSRQSSLHFLSRANKLFNAQYWTIKSNRIENHNTVVLKGKYQKNVSDNLSMDSFTKIYWFWKALTQNLRVGSFWVSRKSQVFRRGENWN